MFNTNPAYDQIHITLSIVVYAKVHKCVLKSGLNLFLSASLVSSFGKLFHAFNLANELLHYSKVLKIVDESVGMHSCFLRKTAGGNKMISWTSLLEVV